MTIGVLHMRGQYCTIDFGFARHESATGKSDVYMCSLLMT
jgi:hypothetical protein